MNIHRILCPIDFSEYNHAANEYASTLAKSTGARIIYLHVFLPDPYRTPPEFYNADKVFKQKSEELKAFIKPTQDTIESTYVVDSGLASDTIVKYAHENEIDLIVLGTHGRTGLKRVLMGSVAEAVIRKAECPVLAIKADLKVIQGK